MKAWTVRQPYASLIVMGAMPYWFDLEPVPPRLIEERVVVWADPEPCDPGDVINIYENIHFEGSAGTGIDVDKASHLITRIRVDQEAGSRISRVPLGAGIGAVVLGRAVPMTEVFPDDPRINTKLWAWPLKAFEQFARPQRAAAPPSAFWDWPIRGELS
jgi:hypothetical protein